MVGTAFAGETPPEVARILKHFQNNENAQALLALSAFEKNNADAEKYLPEIYFEAGNSQRNPHEAGDFFRKVYEDYPDSSQTPPALCAHAQLLYVTGNIRTARTLIDRIIKKHPQSEAVYPAMMLLAAIEIQGGNLRMAANRYAEAALKFSDPEKRALAYVGLGDCKYRLEDLRGAQDAYWKALEQKAVTLDIGKVYYHLGLIARQRVRHGEAKRYFLLIQRQAPHSRYAGMAEAALTALSGDALATCLIGDQTIKPVCLPQISFAVKVGSFADEEKARNFSERFSKAGHKVQVQIRDGAFQVLVGAFNGEMDAFYFSEQLERKFGVHTDIVKLDAKPGEGN